MFKRFLRAGLALGAAVGLFVVPASPAAAADNEVLILGSTVTGGAASTEATEVVAAGFTPVVVTDAQWAAMSAADFGSYRAIVLGDPTCRETPPAAPAANAPVWGGAVDGNALIIGTDPVFHQDLAGARTLMQRGIAFATSETGKTGLYLTLSCYYHGSPPATQVPMLAGLGAFTITGVPGCFNDAHIVATHPALTGLTDADLSNWGCSVHEALQTWPAEFQVLAMARNAGAAYTASDGTVGTPYILARGAGLVTNELSLAPSMQTASIGTTASLTATYLDPASNPIVGRALSFLVVAGPHAGQTGTCAAPCTTNASGQVPWSLIGSAIGVDTVRVWDDTNGNGAADPGERQATAAIEWIDAPDPVIPEASIVALLPISAAALFGAAYVMRRRSGSEG